MTSSEGFTGPPGTSVCEKRTRITEHSVNTENEIQESSGPLATRRRASWSCHRGDLSRTKLDLQRAVGVGDQFDVMGLQRSSEHQVSRLPAKTEQNDFRRSAMHAHGYVLHF